MAAMMKVLLVGLGVVALAGVCMGCAFPQGGCHPRVCSKFNLQDFNALLDPSVFTSQDDGGNTKYDFSKVPASLGYYYGVYNPGFNGGKYDKGKKADRDGAPSLNYFELRNTLGRLNKSSISLAGCCAQCRTAVGCSRWLFNPYIQKRNGVRVFRNVGDCYFLMKAEEGKTWTYEEVDNLCSSETASFVDATVKPYFYSGTCNSEVSDDPHFIGAHGTRFDFNGELDKAFCLLTDQRLHINALLRGYQDPMAGEVSVRSWMKELGFIWVAEDGVKHTLRMVARSGKEQERGDGFVALVELDGEAITIPSEAGLTWATKDMSLKYEGVVKNGRFDMDNYRLKLGDTLDMRVQARPAHPKLQTPTDAEVHFNILIDSMQVTERVHGVLGQTYRETDMQLAKAVKYSILSRILGAPVQADGKTGQGFLEGAPEDYETSSVTAPDCRYTSLVA